jgi:hypothetical protein
VWERGSGGWGNVQIENIQYRKQGIFAGASIFDRLTRPTLGIKHNFSVHTIYNSILKKKKLYCKLTGDTT